MFMPPSRYVLLIDDESTQTQLLGMLLKTRGYDVQVAATAEEAFRKLSPELDIVILDLVLPDSDGFEVCRRIKQNEHTRHIPIIVLSAYSLTEDRLKSLYLGADDFLAKPCEHEELFARMDVVLRRGEKNRLLDDDYTICELHRILAECSIMSYFQPIYQLQPFQLLGMEILTRPVSPGPLGNPEKFFKVALQYGLYAEIEMLAWSRALKIVSAHDRRGSKIFLNCNPYFIESSQFLRVRTLLERSHIPASDVVLEITERSAIPDYHLFYERLGRYREFGFNFAVDDVGGGYASLESIVEIKPEFVKIDGHIVRDLHHDAFKRSIVQFVVQFCNEHGILVVAEGIESETDLEAVKNLGVDAGQGFFLFKPTSALNIENFRDIINSPQFQSLGNTFSI